MLINFHWICFIMKIFIVCYVPAQILYLGELLFLRYEMLLANPIAWFLNELFLQSKLIKQPHLACSYKLTCMVKNGYGQYGLWTLKFTLPQEWTDGINRIFACWYKFMQLKFLSKILGFSLVRNGFNQLCDGILKLTVSKELTDGINRFIQIHKN